MKSEREQLVEGVAELGAQISPEQVDSLIAYLDALEITNRSFNLTRIPREEYVTLHLLDSLTALKALPSDKPISIIDVGTGAGFPGVPLAALLPSSRVTLLDSTLKKVRFAETTAHQCGISNCAAIHGRAEDLAKTKAHGSRYDVVVSRAVAAFPKLMEWTLPLAKVGGYVIAMKGSGYEEEMAGSTPLVARLGGKIEQVLTIPLPLTEITRHLIVVKKVR